MYPQIAISELEILRTPHSTDKSSVITHLKLSPLPLLDAQ